ncbi:MAG: exonuclease domain-containing protein [Methylococcales bacterium]|nr:exonuclease domain-containing protein [Methylococcales bacterium]
MICQWCVTELIKDKDDTPKSLIESLRFNYKNNEIGKIRPIKFLANSQPTAPIYPEAELQQASSVSLREATINEGVLTSIYRSLFNDQERKKEAEKIKLSKQNEIMERYEAEKEAYRLQLISIEQAKKSYLELEASLPKRIEEYIANHLSFLRSTTNQLKSKSDRLLRAHLLGLINADKMILNRPDEDKYERLRDHIKSQDGHACVICHKTSFDSELHVHHIIPLSLYGTNQPQNLVTLCYSCHNKQHPTIKVPRTKPNNSDSRIPRKSTFIAVNIKTTGFFNEDEIIEIGAALFENGAVVNKFHSLLHTRRHIPDKFIEITGITQQMVDSAPKLDIAFPQFMSFIGKSNLVVHNAAFVMPFLQKYAKTFGTIIINNITDTLLISRKKLPQLEGDKIFTLTNYLKTKRTPTNRALDDSIAIGLVFLRLASIKDESPAHQTIKKPTKRPKSINKPNEGFVPTIKSLEKKYRGY